MQNFVPVLADKIEGLWSRVVNIKNYLDKQIDRVVPPIGGLYFMLWSLLMAFGTGLSVIGDNFWLVITIMYPGLFIGIKSIYVQRFSYTESLIFWLSFTTIIIWLNTKAYFLSPVFYKSPGTNTLGTEIEFILFVLDYGFGQILTLFLVFIPVLIFFHVSMYFIYNARRFAVNTLRLVNHGSVIRRRLKQDQLILFFGVFPFIGLLSLFFFHNYISSITNSLIPGFFTPITYYTGEIEKFVQSIIGAPRIAKLLSYLAGIATLYGMWEAFSGMLKGIRSRSLK